MKAQIHCIECPEDFMAISTTATRVVVEVEEESCGEVRVDLTPARAREAARLLIEAAAAIELVAP